MLRIFNKKLNAEIQIDDKLSWITVTPKTYEDKPHIKIEFSCGFRFLKHTQTCIDCDAFLKSFGKNSYDWFVEYMENQYVIITDSFKPSVYGENSMSDINSKFKYGSEIQFKVMKLDKETLNTMLSESVSNEEYERACIFRDLSIELNLK